MEIVELKLDEENELLFNVHIEGTSASSVAVRMMCESENYKAYFDGKFNGNEVQVIVPELKKDSSFLENKNYNAHLEIVIENKFFIPLKFNVKFKESIKIQAEMVNKNSDKEIIQETTNVFDVVKKNNPVVTATIVNKEERLLEEKNKGKKEILEKLKHVVKK